MQFIKTHLVSLICGVLILGFVVVAVIGMSNNSVTEAAKKRTSEVSKIDSLTRSPKNQECIEEKKKQSEASAASCDEALAFLAQKNRREPLQGNVFPKEANQSSIFEFARSYDTAFRQLREKLYGGGVPTEKDVEDARIDIDEQQRLMDTDEDKDADNNLLGSSGSGRNSRRSNRPQYGGGAPGPYGGYGPPGGGYGPPGGGTRPSSGVDKDDLRFDPAYRAAVNKARSIRVYIDENAFHTLDLGQYTAGAPLDELWYAQVSLWIQQDVIAAICDLNDSFAARVEGVDPCVEHVPVKRIESIRVHSYRTESGDVPFPSGEGDRSSEGAAESFTERKSTEDFDVVTFGMTVWVDQREINRLLDRIMLQNFFQCVDLDYTAAENANLEESYMFGTAPVVRLELEFEAYMARSIFEPLMPKAIKEALGIEKAADDKKRR